MFETVVKKAEYLIWSFGIPFGDEEVPLLVLALLGTGIFLTLRLGFIQARRLGHGFAVTTGRYDDPNAAGDVSHFQALTTALSATVGIGNIAGVAIAIHWGGPGALFWMWMSALFGMALKYSEVTLAQHFREVVPVDPAHPRFGTVSGGPMYYIERGLGPRWKPVAVFTAAALCGTALLGSNATQSNTVADNLHSQFGLPTWVSGLLTASLVAMVVIGGIRRIGGVTSILAPAMAALYMAGALTILALNAGEIVPALETVLREAFSPSAGVAGTGAGALMVTLMWGVRRGLYSNEAGQGSAPIAHAAAQTDEPVSEGTVALLEPFLDTIVICTTTGLVLLTTGVWQERVPTALTLEQGDLSWIELRDDGRWTPTALPATLEITDGRPPSAGPQLAWHEVAVERFFIDEAHTRPFTGRLEPAAGRAIAADGSVHATLYGNAVENGAPLTLLAFERELGRPGALIVVFSVLLFAVSTAISWSYYGERCVNYLFGPRAIVPFRLVYVTFHFGGAIFTLTTVWTVGDVVLGLATFPNLVAVVLLSGLVAKLTRSYFERRPWETRPWEKRAGAAR